MFAVYFGLVLTRVATFVTVMPLFASRTPKTIRAMLALVLSIYWFGAVTPAMDPKTAIQTADVHWLAYTLALFREATIGVIIGFAFSLFLMPAQIAGEFASQQIGLAVSPQAGLANNAPVGPLTMIFEGAASLLFLEMDGHHIVLSALHVSFDKLPLGGTLVPMPAESMVGGLTSAYQMGLLLGGPLGLCLFLLSIVLSIMARAAPQLNIYSVGFTLQVAVALVGSMFLMPDMLRLMALIIGHTGVSVPKFME